MMHINSNFGGRNGPAQKPNPSASAFVADVEGIMRMPCKICHLRYICFPNMWRKVVDGEEFQLATCNLFTHVPEEVRTLAAAQFSNQMCADASRACSTCSAVVSV